MPANYVWAPPAGMLGMPPPPPPSFTTLTNWRVGVGPTDFATELPNGDDHLYFIGGISSANCTIPDQTPTAPTNAFAGIHLNFGLEAVPTEIGSPPPPPANVPYSGTVTVADSLAVGELDVDCGAIAQADPNAPTGTAGTLTVNGHLDWTGGTLNSSTTAGTIALASGATGVAEPSFTNPGINAAVDLGSVLTTLGDSTLTLKSGTYNLSVEASFVASGSSLITLNPVPKPNPTSEPLNGDIYINDKPGVRGAGGMVLVEECASAVFESEDPEASSTDPLRVIFSGKSPGIENWGNVTVAGHTEVVLKPVGSTTGQFAQKGEYAYTMLEPGAQITCQQESQVNIEKGRLLLVDKEGASGSQPDAYITNTTEATALVLGEEAVIRRPATSSFAYHLQVKGGFDFQGRVELLADPTNENKADRITAWKQIVVGTTATVAMRWFDVTGTPVDINDEWILLKSYAGGADPISALPQFDAPGVSNGITLLVGERNSDNSRFHVVREQ